MGLSRPDAHLLVLGALAGLVYGAVYPVIGLVYSFLVAALGGPPDDIMSKGTCAKLSVATRRTIFASVSIGTWFWRIAGSRPPPINTI
jgi:hypothetical protein